MEIIVQDGVVPLMCVLVYMRLRGRWLKIHGKENCSLYIIQNQGSEEYAIVLLSTHLQPAT